jgi:DegV family protein with EDD domain
MTVKIVTDSGADLPAELIREFNISVVPIYIYFGKEAYKDGIDITTDELYRRLAEDAVYPTTTQPLPVDFVNIYRQLSKETDEIVSIHMSHKVSGTYNSAVQGKKMIENGARIEVIDSFSVSMGLGLVTLAAARIAKAGGTIDQVVDAAVNVIKSVKLFGVFDTLKYLLAGGRITKARAVIGSILNIKPILTMNNGEIVQYNMVRSFQKGVEKLAEMVRKTTNVEEVAIVHSTIPEEAMKLKKLIESIVDEEKIIMCRLGAGLGVHGGPGTLFTVIRSGS